MGKTAADAEQVSAAGVDTSQSLALSDPTSALNQFQQAANIIQQQYPGALEAFQNYVTQGSKGQLDLQQQALVTQLPVSDTASTAMNELRGFMGLQPISPTAGLSTQMNQSINQLRLSGNPQAADLAAELAGIQGQLQQAESIQDPQEREMLKADIMDQFDSFNQAASSTLGPQFNQLAPQLQGLQKQFETGYGAEPQSAWSPEQIQARLEATPGYQFQLDQGMKALERTAAARGNLLSGNTLLAAQEYGQGLANQTYQQQLQNLRQTANISAPAMQQQAGLLSQAGATVGQLGTQLGSAAGDTAQNIANAGQQAANLQGQGLLQNTALQSQLAQQGALQGSQQQQQANVANAQLQQQTNLANAQQDQGLLNLVLQTQK